MYFNTTNLKKEELKSAHKRTTKQADVILDIFEESPFPLSPSTILKITKDLGFSWPITSIRRAISDMTKVGALIKLNTKVKSSYGAKEHLWIAARLAA